MTGEETSSPSLRAQEESVLEDLPSKAPISSVPAVLDASIILLCGIPGSGKSTLAKSIVEYYSQHLPCNTCSTGGETHNATVAVDVTTTPTTKLDDSSTNDQRLPPQQIFDAIVTIDYDDITSSIVKTLKEKEMMENHTKNGDDNNIHEKINASSNTEKNGESEECKHGENGKERKEGSDFSKEELEAWRMTRKEALVKLDYELQKGLQLNRKLLVLMDDNFHLRSMRRDVYKACQDFVVRVQDEQHPVPVITIGLVLIHVNTPLEQCLVNNETRRGTSQYIPTRIIHDMNSVFEIPNTTSTMSSRGDMNTSTNNKSEQKTKFESCTMSINNYDNGNSLDVYQLLDTQIQKSKMEENKIRPPLQPMNQKSVEQLRIEREETMKSKLHRVDLLLRSLVGAVCREHKSFAKGVNAARKSIMNECKKGCNSMKLSMSLLESTAIADDDAMIVTEFQTRTIVNTDCSTEEEEQLKVIIKETFESFSRKHNIN